MFRTWGGGVLFGEEEFVNINGHQKKIIEKVTLIQTCRPGGIALGLGGGGNSFVAGIPRFIHTPFRFRPMGPNNAKGLPFSGDAQYDGAP